MIRQDAEARTVFLATLDWLVAVAKRYASPIEFGLVYIAFGNKNELGETYGAQDAVRQLAELTHALQQTFRKTDMVARNGTDYWIIVPFAPATERIHEKVIEILRSAEHNGLLVVERKTCIFTLSRLLTELDKSVTDFGALRLLEHLKENRHSYAQHLLEIPAER